MVKIPARSRAYGPDSFRSRIRQGYWSNIRAPVEFKAKFFNPKLNRVEMETGRNLWPNLVSLLCYFQFNLINYINLFF